MQFYRYFVSLSSEFCDHNPYIASQRVFIVVIVVVYFVIDSVRKLLVTPSYAAVQMVLWVCWWVCLRFSVRLDFCKCASDLYWYFMPCENFLFCCRFLLCWNSICKLLRTKTLNRGVVTCAERSVKISLACLTFTGVAVASAENWSSSWRQ
jgi:hypothetical protein